MPRTIFDSRLRAARFMLLSQDRLWDILSENEKTKVVENCNLHNNFRDDYLDPVTFNGGSHFDSTEDRLTSTEGLWLAGFMDRVRPRSVLEVGFGSGYFTRMIAECGFVDSYYGVDINNAFVSFLNERLTRFNRSGFRFGVYSSFELLPKTLSFDAVILMNAFHHVPDRVGMFKDMGSRQRRGSRVLCIDPSHYLTRMVALTKKVLTPGYLKKKMDQRSFATHHFCSVGEARRVARMSGMFRVVDYRFDAAWPMAVRAMIKLANAIELSDDHPFRRTPLHRVLSHYVMLEYERT